MVNICAMRKTRSGELEQPLQGEFRRIAGVKPCQPYLTEPALTLRRKILDLNRRLGRKFEGARIGSWPGLGRTGRHLCRRRVFLLSRKDVEIKAQILLITSLVSAKYGNFRARAWSRRATYVEIANPELVHYLHDKRASYLQSSNADEL